MQNFLKLTVAQALQKGIEAQKAGRLQEADKYYTAILKDQPSHPDANNNLGVIAVSIGKIERPYIFQKCHRI